MAIIGLITDLSIKSLPSDIRFAFQRAVVSMVSNNREAFYSIVRIILGLFVKVWFDGAKGVKIFVNESDQGPLARLVHPTLYPMEVVLNPFYFQLFRMEYFVECFFRLC